MPDTLSPLPLFVDEKNMESFRALYMAIYMVLDPENPPLGIPGYEYGDDYEPLYPDEETPSLDHYELWVTFDDTGEQMAFPFDSVDEATEFMYELSQTIWEQGDLPEYAN